MLHWIIIILLVLVFAAVPVAAALGILSLSLDELYMNGRLSRAIGEFTWDKSKEYILVAIPMFILLGEIMLRAGIAKRMYEAVVEWLSWLPGGLMHANIGSCAIFAASSGSSVATAATVGTVAYPEIEKRRYSERLFLGSLAAGGTLGILIPPSISLIIYGLITDTSVPELYLAGIIPGLMLSMLFIGAIVIACSVRKGWGGDTGEDFLAQTHTGAPRSHPPDIVVRRRCRFDLCRRRHADGSSLTRCGIFAGPRCMDSQPEFAHAARSIRRDHAHDGDDHADHSRRRVS